jgi:O-Antigen ligase
MPDSGVRLLQAAVVVELVMSVFEGPLRYGLHAIHLDALIFGRDALLALAVAWFLIARSSQGRAPAGAAIFGMLLLAHAVVSYLNLHSSLAIAYGAKLALPLLAGYLVPGSIFAPGPQVWRLIVLLWCATVIGAAVDASMGRDMPWVGVSTNLGGVDVELARDWQSGSVKRVGGLMRYSNSLAIMLPLLSLVLLGAVRHPIVRAVIYACTLLVLFWTTQKGAILGFAIVTAAMALSTPQRSMPLRLAIVLMACMTILAPTVLIQFRLPQTQGVFSLQSFSERIVQMWPDGWHWVNRFPPLAGVGLGGIGGAQRFYAPQDFNAGDNLFLFLYANCGIFAIAYLCIACVVCCCAATRSQREIAAMGSAVFLFSYGVVVSLVEDQIAALWLGATVGWLAAAHRRGTEPARQRCEVPGPSGMALPQ